MMRQSSPALDQLIAIRPADEAIQQTIPVNVTGFFAAKKEPDPAKPMHTDAPFRPCPHGRFNRADRAKPRRIKKPGRGEQHRVENLGRAGNSREPFQPPNGEREN